MNHWIVKVTHRGHISYSHVESAADPVVEAKSKGQKHIVSVEAGPCTTPEEAWIAWHKKHGNLAE